MDRDLVEAARDGDREAYADLIRVRGDRLFAIAQRILRDVDRTEDAVQDALVIAWRDLPGLRDPDRFDAWLYRLVVRAASPRRCASAASSANLSHAPDRPPEPHRRLPPVADRDQLERGFRRLPPSSARCSCSATTPASSRPRSRPSSASRRGPSGPDSIMPTAPCAPPSRQMPARPRSEDSA